MALAELQVLRYACALLRRPNLSHRRLVGLHVEACKLRPRVFASIADVVEVEVRLTACWRVFDGFLCCCQPGGIEMLKTIFTEVHVKAFAANLRSW